MATKSNMTSNKNKVKTQSMTFARKEFFIFILSTFLIGMILWTVSPGASLFVMSLAFIYGIATISLNFQEGQTGIVNFGVVGFIAIGAYTTSILTLMNWHWTIALAAGVFLTAVAAYLISLPTLKLREDYFAIVIITIGEIIRIFFQQEEWFVYPPSQAIYYGGTKGLAPKNQIAEELVSFVGTDWLKSLFSTIRDTLIGLGVPKTFTFKLVIPNWYEAAFTFRVADLFQLEFADIRTLYFVVVISIICIVTYFIFERFYNSPLGRLNKAIREDPLVVDALGFDSYRQQVQVMTVGAMAAGLAGGLYAYQSAAIAPNFFLPIFTFLVWTMLIVGGLANNRGALIGAFLIVGLQQIIISYKLQIGTFLSALTEPLLPRLAEVIVPPLKNWQLIDTTINLPLNIEWTITVSISFILVLILLLIPYMYVRILTKRKSADLIKKRTENAQYLDLIEKSLKLLLILTVLPFLFNITPLYPTLTFDRFKNVTSVKFVSLATFFKELDPLLIRVIFVGILMILFLLFKPEGILKERIILTINPYEQLNRYLEQKSKNVETYAFDGGNQHNKQNSDTITAKDNKTLLEGERLTKSFGGIQALREASIAIKKGPIIGIIGPNGSGKSTLFNVLSGILEQDKGKEGKITLEQKEITTLPPHQRAQLGLGRTFQVARVFKNMTVLENLLVSFPFQKGTKFRYALFKKEWIDEEMQLHQRAFQILDFLNLMDVWDSKAAEISGGQQKLVALGRALMHESKLILLDEPVAGVNPTLAKKIFEKITNLHRSGKHHFVIIEHNMDVQLNFCDYIYVMNKGEIVAEGTPEEITKNQEVIEAYLGQ